VCSLTHVYQLIAIVTRQRDDSDDSMHTDDDDVFAALDAEWGADDARVPSDESESDASARDDDDSVDDDDDNDDDDDDDNDGDVDDGLADGDGSDIEEVAYSVCNASSVLTIQWRAERKQACACVCESAGFCAAVAGDHTTAP
jgi:hypothetical protein